MTTSHLIPLRNWWRDKVHNMIWGETLEGKKVRAVFILDIEDRPDRYIVHSREGYYLLYKDAEQVLPRNMKTLKKGDKL